MTYEPSPIHKFLLDAFLSECDEKTIKAFEDYDKAVQRAEKNRSHNFIICSQEVADELNKLNDDK